MRQVKRSEIRLSDWNVTIIAAPVWAFDRWGDRYRSLHESFVDVLAVIDGIRDAINRKRRADYEALLIHDPASSWVNVLRTPRKFKPAMGLLSYPTENNRKACGVCHGLFFGMGNVMACSDACAKALRDASRTRGEPKRVDRTPKDCEHCGGRFNPPRSDARYCSGRCRVAAHRGHARASGV